MRILFTFERPMLCIRGEDYYNLLLHFGHEVFIYCLDNSKDAKWLKADRIHHNNFHILEKRPQTETFEAWYYDLTGPDHTVQSAFSQQLSQFKGKFLACINYDDGYEFFEFRISDDIKRRTHLFMNNALYLDRTRYHALIQQKLFLTTSYISNSQAFKHDYLQARHKLKRVFFSGSVTGGPSPLTSFSLDERKLRITLVMKVFEAKNIPSILRFVNYDPLYKKFFDAIPSELRTTIKGSGEHHEELRQSLFCLAIKGNSYPTNRFFESQAAGCITLSTKLDGEVQIYGVGTKTIDYIEIDASGSDLIPQITSLMNDPDRCQAIGDSGRNNWAKYNRLDDKGLYTPLTIWHHISNIRELTGFDITKR